MFPAIPVFSTALMGLLIGFVGKGMMPSKDTGGAITTSCVGLCGASLTASIGWLMGFFTVGSLPGYLAGFGGAILLLIVYRIFAGLEIST